MMMHEIFMKREKISLSRVKGLFIYYVISDGGGGLPDLLQYYMGGGQLHLLQYYMGGGPPNLLQYYNWRGGLLSWQS